MNGALAARLWLVIPLVLVLAPHAIRLPVWLSLAWLSCAGLSLWSAARRRPPVGRALKMLLTLAGVAGVLLQFGTVIGPAGGVALLAFLSGAKLLELEKERDWHGLLFVGVFLLVAHFLDGQSMATAAYMVVAALALTGGFIAGQSATTDLTAPRRLLAPAAVMLAQALPLAILLFLLFPRLHGPLWGLPQQTAAKSGLSDRMSPGDISQLILSDELAFRAEFPGLAPAARLAGSQLYWRGPVLWDFDGRAWSGARAAPPGPPLAEARDKPVRYVLTLEPHRQRWLFLLGLPEDLPDLPASLGSDLQWLARDPVNQRLRYEAGAHLDYVLEPELGDAARARALDLPTGGNPRARELARAWRADAASETAVVERALAHFRRENFFYTLAPPALGEEAVDEFLFATRRGFCEHYAGAFTFLMRAAGVPARVVTGYQGGEYNPMGNYWIVRGRDAHAWAEVWLPGRGWVRVDPTAAVAPSRVERGIDAALPAAERTGRLIHLEGAWLRPLRLGWDLLNNQWNQWVLGYNQERQRQLLSRLSPALSTLKGMVAVLAVAASLAVLAVAAMLFRRPRAAVDRAARAYARFCSRLAPLGLERGAAEGAEDFSRRAARARPDLADPIQAITRLYVGARYGPKGGVEALESAVRGFRPSRRAP